MHQWFPLYRDSTVFLYTGIFQYEYFVVYSVYLFSTFHYFWKHVYLLSCWFHSVEVFCIKFIFRETFIVINSVTRFLSIETLYKFRTINCWYTRVFKILHKFKCFVYPGSLSFVSGNVKQSEEFYLVLMFPYSVHIGEKRPEKFRIWTIFTQHFSTW